jgi:alpha/beta hydrolase family protein
MKEQLDATLRAAWDAPEELPAAEAWLASTRSEALRQERQYRSGDGSNRPQEVARVREQFPSGWGSPVRRRSARGGCFLERPFNVVIFDSPADLPVARHWSAARESTDHLSRVEDVVRHYKGRLGKPVWVMGHSMGSISITELYKRLQDRKSEDLVAGLILSGGENGTSFNYETTRLPVLVLHHENDGCAGNTPDYAKRIHTKLREAGNRAAELVLINSGAPSPNGNPCRSGYHMYFGAGPEVAKVLDQFMNKHLVSR